MKDLKHRFEVGDLVQLRFWNDYNGEWEIVKCPPYIVIGLGDIDAEFGKCDDPVGRAFVTVVGGELHDIRIIPSAYLVHCPKLQDSP